jgi:hypothetical protein
MKTILKFPIYVEIDSDNVDRKLITDAARSVLYPTLIQFVGSASIRRKVLEQFREASGVANLDIKFLTEIDLFKERSS